MNRRTLLLCAPFACALPLSLLAGCQHNEEFSSPPGVTNVQPRPNDRPIRRLAEVRCDREVSCQRIGAGKGHATRDDCVDDYVKRGHDDLRDDQCEIGVEGGQLDRCLHAIRADACDDKLDSIDALDACKKDNLCARR